MAGNNVAFALGLAQKAGKIASQPISAFKNGAMAISVTAVITTRPPIPGKTPATNGCR